MAKNIIKGKKLMVFIKDGSTYKSIALSTNHTLTLSAGTKELAVKTKDDAEGKSWADSEIDTMSWTVSSESLVGTNEGKGFGDIMDLYLAGSKVDIVFDGVTADGVPTGGYTPVSGVDETAPAGVTEADGFYGYKGQALITSLTLNAPLEDNASYTVEFTGCGALSPYTA